MTKTLLFIQGIYDTIDLFIAAFSEAFRQTGFRCHVIDIRNPKEALQRLKKLTEEETIDGVITFNNIGYNLSFSGGRNLWEEKGIAGFDLAVSAQDRDSAYYQLKELLKTQHPRVVVVDIYAICHEKHMVESNIYRNYLSMRASLNSIMHIISYSEEEKQKELLARWPIVHTRYRELKEYDFIPYEPSVIGRGSLITWDQSAVENENGINLCKTVQPLSERNQKWIQDLIALSEEEGFELIQDIMQAGGELDTRVPYDDLIRTDFAEKAMQ